MDWDSLWVKRCLPPRLVTTTAVQSDTTISPLLFSVIQRGRRKSFIPLLSYCIVCVSCPLWLYRFIRLYNTIEFVLIRTPTRRSPVNEEQYIHCGKSFSSVNSIKVETVFKFLDSFFLYYTSHQRKSSHPLYLLYVIHTLWRNYYTGLPDCVECHLLC